MTCPAVQTGQHFLATTLGHIDCQAQTIGSYGYGALADPGSPVSLALVAFLTIFIAIFGIRLLAGVPVAGRDIVGELLRLAIVLTLATSWPAWRVVGYDVLISGPAEMSRSIGLAAQLPGAAGDLDNRLQWVDDALSALNVYGSGRLGVASGDWFQLGFARSAFMTGVLGPLALIRLTTGIFLAIAPLMAGLALFGLSRPLFAGWVKGLALAFLASLALSLIYGAELALLEPWLQETLKARAAEQQTLDAPVEILVLTLSFALVAFGVIAITAKMVFSAFSLSAPLFTLWNEGVRAANMPDPASVIPSYGSTVSQRHSHASQVALAMTTSLVREERLAQARSAASPLSGAGASLRGRSGSQAMVSPVAQGSGGRRSTRRISAAGQKRDKVQ